MKPLLNRPTCQGLFTLGWPLGQLILLAALAVGAVQLCASSLYAAGRQPLAPSPQPERPAPHSIKPDVMGMRVMYGHSSLSAEASGVAPIEEDLFGSAVALEWSLFHHHLELELVGGVFQHHGLVDEFGEVIFKLPIHLTNHVDLLFGLGGIVETNRQRPELGVASDINLRLWRSAHWGISAEVDYISLESGSVAVEGIAEVLYRF